MLQNRSFLISYKLFFALLGLSAVITEIAVLNERGAFNFVNFFSYFTIQTNILIAAVFLTSAFLSATKMNDRVATIRSAALVYILVVGIGFSVLLSGIDGLILTAVPWDNMVLHYIIPLAVLVDYLIDRPKNLPRFDRAIRWITYPIIYIAYSMTRGALTNWYPYPFLNPLTKGYEPVLITITGLLLLTLALIWLTIHFSGKNKRTAKKS